MQQYVSCEIIVLLGWPNNGDLKIHIKLPITYFCENRYSALLAYLII